jgi:hypothetical protein
VLRPTIAVEAISAATAIQPSRGSADRVAGFAAGVVSPRRGLRMGRKNRAGQRLIEALKTGEAFHRGFDKIGQPDGHAPRV